MHALTECTPNGGLFDKIVVKYYRCGAEETQTLVTPTGLDLLAQILEDEKL